MFQTVPKCSKLFHFGDKLLLFGFELGTRFLKQHLPVKSGVCKAAIEVG